jgi:hypothetical protein
MKINITVILIVISISAFSVKAQEFNPKVSRDSVGILSAQIEALKASQKVQELKLKEFDEQQEVEKLRVKLMLANDIAKASTLKSTEIAEKLKGTTDIKTQERAAKQAKTDTEDAQKVSERFKKQIEKVELLRGQIQMEERKLTYKKPIVLFDHK